VVTVGGRRWIRCRLCLLCCGVCHLPLWLQHPWKNTIFLPRKLKLRKGNFMVSMYGCNWCDEHLGYIRLQITL
jgi:hypothetical protein